MNPTSLEAQDPCEQMMALQLQTILTSSKELLDSKGFRSDDGTRQALAHSDTDRRTRELQIDSTIELVEDSGQNSKFSVTYIDVSNDRENRKRIRLDSGNYVDGSGGIHLFANSMLVMSYSRHADTSVTISLLNPDLALSSLGELSKALEDPQLKVNTLPIQLRR